MNQGQDCSQEQLQKLWWGVVGSAFAVVRGNWIHDVIGIVYLTIIYTLIQPRASSGSFSIKSNTTPIHFIYICFFLRLQCVWLCKDRANYYLFQVVVSSKINLEMHCIHPYLKGTLIFCSVKENDMTLKFIHTHLYPQPNQMVDCFFNCNAALSIKSSELKFIAFHLILTAL